MKTRRKTIAMILVTCAMIFSLQALQYKDAGDWKGGSSGRWGDPNNWVGGVVPGATPDGVGLQARFWTTAGDRIEIDVDGEFYPERVVFGQKSTVFCGPNRPVVRLKKSSVEAVIHASTAENKYSQVYNDQEVVLDGVAFDGWGLNVYATNAITLVNGARLTIDGNVLFNNPANTVVVESSELELASLVMSDDSRLMLSNAVLSVSNKTISFGHGSTSSICKSTVRAGSNVTSELLVPGNGSTIETYRNAGVAFPGGEGVCYNLSGVVCVTNANGFFGGSGASTSYGGRGAVYAHTFSVPDTKQAEVDLSFLAVGSQIYSYKENQNSRLRIYGPATLGAFGDWTMPRQARIDVEGAFVVDTLDCFTKNNVHTFELRCLYPLSGSSLTIQGGGSGSIGFNDVFYRWQKVELKDGSDLSFWSTPGSATYSAYPRLYTSKLSLGAGSQLSVTANDTVVDVTGVPTFEPGSAIVVTPPAVLEDGRRYPVLLSPAQSDLSALTFVEVSKVDGWILAAKNGAVFYTDGKSSRLQVPYEWTGAADNKLGVDRNWYGEAVPPLGESADIVFSGHDNCDIVNDLVMSKPWRTVTFRNGGPWRMSGNTLFLNGYYPSNGGRAIVNNSDLPVQIDCDFSSAAKSASVIAQSNSYVRLNGTTTISKIFIPSGDIRIGGALTCDSFQIEKSYGTSPDTRLTICKGGSMTVLNQSSESTLANGAGMMIEDGAALTFNGETSYRVTRSGFRHLVNGRFVCNAPFSATTDCLFAGTGRVDIASVRSSTEDVAMILKGGITLVPHEGWTTVTADNQEHFVKIRVETRATLGAVNDWTYGPAAGTLPGTSAATRALIVQDPLSVVTVNTQDPNTFCGHTVVFSDPIVGSGSVVKTGAGTIVLASPENSAAGGILVESGVLAWTVDQQVSRLTMSHGTSLRFGIVDGAPATMTVASDVDLAGVMVEPMDDAAVAAMPEYVTILETTSKLTGIPETSDKYRLRIVEGRKIQIKERRGLVLIVK